MTEQQACTLCGAGGHTAAQCNRSSPEKLALLVEELSFEASHRKSAIVDTLRRAAVVVQAYLAAQQGEQATHAEIAQVHPEQAEGAQGDMKPCPFCGEPAEERADEPDGRGWFACSNNECPCWHLQAEAHDWNNRAALAQPSPAYDPKRCLACGGDHGNSGLPCPNMRVTAQAQPSTVARDWPEDFQHENGNYECVCVKCGNTFFGYKHRMICKACTQPSPKCATCNDTGQIVVSGPHYCGEFQPPEYETEPCDMCAQPSPAPEMDPLGLAPHAAAFNEAPAEALKPDLELPEVVGYACLDDIQWGGDITLRPEKSEHYSVPFAPVAQAGQVPDGYVLAKQTVVEMPDGKKELGYTLIDGLGIFDSSDDVIDAIKELSLPIGWVSMTVEQLLPGRMLAAAAPAQGGAA